MIMRKVYYILLCCVWLGQVACQDKGTEVGGQGRIRLSITDRVISKALPDALSPELTDRFQVEMIRLEDNRLVFGGTCADFNARSQLFRSGEHTIQVSYGDNPLLAMDAPYYVSEKETVIVESGTEQEVVLQCRVGNAVASFEFLNADNTPVYVDDDEYWKTGFYYNPNDRHMLVADRMQSGNYSFNYATAGAKIWTGILTFVVAGTIVFTVAAMLPLIHVKVDFIMENNRLTVEGGGYKITFDKESIQKAELLDTMPRDNFTKTNGGATETYAVGHFKGNTYGKCMLFIYKGNAPYILIQTDTQTMFFNAKDSSMTKQWYEQLCE